MGILEKISEIEYEISRTQKNKATEHHLGKLKAKLARFRAELLEGSKGSSEKGEGFEVIKSGDSRVVMIGFPSVGKSTLLTKLTKTKSETAAYEFTTLTCIPGNIEYNGARIQLLDLPGIIEGASEGKGRGRQVIAVARTADLILMMLDASKGEIQRHLLTKELESVGIRLNKRPANITFKEKKAGGISFNATCKLTHMSESLCKSILQEYKIHNADILFREDATADDFIDMVVGKTVYLRCLYCFNKCDLVSLEECERLARMPDTVVASCELGLNFSFLLECIWAYLALVRVFTKKRGEMPDFGESIILRSGSTVRDVCRALHRTMENHFKAALVWGTSSKHQPQRVGLTHVLEDEDVIQIIKK
eukprot:m.77387 g.77387  ORF g.77387 m.77387 type:complete len:365 (+) comp14696_c0_seq1:121-1215(+)